MNCLNPRCKKTFVSKHHSQKYCCIRCCNSAAKRREFLKKKDSGLCIQCGGVKDSHQTRCLKCRNLRSRHSKKLARSRKLTFIEKYGGKCECCGETKWEFLSLDHVRGDGYKDRTKNRNILYKKAVVDFDPSKYRVLCMNCNTAIGFYGYCPHNSEMI